MPVLDKSRVLRSSAVAQASHQSYQRARRYYSSKTSHVSGKKRKFITVVFVSVCLRTQQRQQDCMPHISTNPFLPATHFRPGGIPQIHTYSSSSLGENNLHTLFTTHTYGSRSAPRPRGKSRHHNRLHHRLHSNFPPHARTRIPQASASCRCRAAGAARGGAGRCRAGGGEG